MWADRGVDTGSPRRHGSKGRGRRRIRISRIEGHRPRDRGDRCRVAGPGVDVEGDVGQLEDVLPRVGDRAVAHASWTSRTELLLGGSRSSRQVRTTGRRPWPTRRSRTSTPAASRGQRRQRARHGVRSRRRVHEHRRVPVRDHGDTAARRRRRADRARTGTSSGSPASSCDVLGPVRDGAEPRRAGRGCRRRCTAILGTEATRDRGVARPVRTHSRDRLPAAGPVAERLRELGAAHRAVVASRSAIVA